MTVVVMAGYPWNAIKPICGREPSEAWLLSDSRVSSAGVGLGDFHTPKQFVLARNMSAAFSSSHVRATVNAFWAKLRDPTTQGPGSTATERDVRRLGRLLRSEHNNLGGLSEVLVTFWPLAGVSPHLYQLMPPDYGPRLRRGIVGVGGDRAVLDRFVDLLPAQLERQRLSPDDVQFNPTVVENLRRQFGYRPAPVSNEAYMAVRVAFIDALLDAGGRTADVPVSYTRLTAQGVSKDGEHIAVLTESDDLIRVSDFSKPAHHGHVIRIEPYSGPRLRARQLFP